MIEAKTFRSKSNLPVACARNDASPNENVVNCSGVTREGEKRSEIHPSEIPNAAGDSSQKQVHVCLHPAHPLLGLSHLTIPVNNNPFEWKLRD